MKVRNQFLSRYLPPEALEQPLYDAWHALNLL